MYVGAYDYGDFQIYAGLVWLRRFVFVGGLIVVYIFMPIFWGVS